MHTTGLQAYNTLRNEFNLYSVGSIDQEAAKQLALNCVKASLNTGGRRLAIQLYTDISTKRWYK